MVEIEIAKRIMLNPKPNVVRVFDVVKTAKECYIDMEQLDVEDVTWGKCILDVMNGLAQLHTLDVVYIDVKEDNVGYSHVDGAYKLFDFNCSGVISSKDKMTWLYRPYKEGFTYKNVRTHEYTLASLCTLDDIIILDIANRLMKGITR
jgi:serine/threonine protein kinase